MGFHASRGRLSTELVQKVITVVKMEKNCLGENRREDWNYRVDVYASLFQAFCQCGRLKKRAGDERGLVEKDGGDDERACEHCFKNFIPVYQLPPSPFHSRIPLVVRSLFLSSLLTESLEQAMLTQNGRKSATRPSALEVSA